MMILQGPRDVVDIVVGSHGALRKLFHEGYLKTGRTSMLALDEIDTLLDDTFKVIIVLFEELLRLCGPRRLLWRPK